MSHKFLTPDELSAIAAREKATTPGPWKSTGCDVTDWNDDEKNYTMEILANQISDQNIPDLIFIAHARADIPRLLAEVAALREVLEAVYAKSQDTRELNMGNYTDDDVSALNSGLIEIHGMLAAAIGKEPTP